LKDVEVQLLSFCFNQKIAL